MVADPLPRLVIQCGERRVFLKSKSTTWEGFLADVRQKTGLGAIARVEYTGVQLLDFDSLEDCEKDDVLDVFGSDAGSTSLAPAVGGLPQSGVAKDPAEALGHPEYDELFGPPGAGTPATASVYAEAYPEDDELLGPPGAAPPPSARIEDFDAPVLAIPKWKQRQMAKAAEMEVRMAEEMRKASQAEAPPETAGANPEDDELFGPPGATPSQASSGPTNDRDLASPPTMTIPKWKQRQLTMAQKMEADARAAREGDMQQRGGGSGVATPNEGAAEAPVGESFDAPLDQPPTMAIPRWRQRQIEMARKMESEAQKAISEAGAQQQPGEGQGTRAPSTQQPSPPSPPQQQQQQQQQKRAPVPLRSYGMSSSPPTSPPGPPPSVVDANEFEALLERLGVPEAQKVQMRGMDDRQKTLVMQSAAMMPAAPPPEAKKETSAPTPSLWQRMGGNIGMNMGMGGAKKASSGALSPCEINRPGPSPPTTPVPGATPVANLEDPQELAAAEMFDHVAHDSLEAPAVLAVPKWKVRQHAAQKKMEDDANSAAKPEAKSGPPLPSSAPPPVPSDETKTGPPLPSAPPPLPSHAPPPTPIIPGHPPPLPPPASPATESLEAQTATTSRRNASPQRQLPNAPSAAVNRSPAKPKPDRPLPNPRGPKLPSAVLIARRNRDQCQDAGSAEVDEKKTISRNGTTDFSHIDVTSHKKQFEATLNLVAPGRAGQDPSDQSPPRPPRNQRPSRVSNSPLPRLPPLPQKPGHD